MLPVLYNNLKKIVQTEDHVLIHVEMVHDARIVRMNQEHAPPEIRSWLGDSVGRWEGDTLVVDTTNFNDTPALGGASRNLHVIERFTRIAPDALLYRFTVEDPTVWTAPWSGEYVWPATGDRVYEYACHEANYSFRAFSGARGSSSRTRATRSRTPADATDSAAGRSSEDRPVRPNGGATARLGTPAGATGSRPNRFAARDRSGVATLERVGGDVAGR